MLCSMASRLGLGDNNKRELESERKKEEEEEEEEGDHPSTHVAVEKAQARGRPGRRLCACARVVWYGIRKRDPATPQSSRELRDTKLQKRRGTERTRPPAWPCVKVYFLRTHAWTFWPVLLLLLLLLLLRCFFHGRGAPPSTPPTSRGWEGDAGR